MAALERLEEFTRYLVGLADHELDQLGNDLNVRYYASRSVEGSQFYADRLRAVADEKRRREDEAYERGGPIEEDA